MNDKQRYFYITYYYKNNNGYNSGMGYFKMKLHKYPSEEDIRKSVCMIFDGEKETLKVITIAITELTEEDYNDFISNDVFDFDYI